MVCSVRGPYRVTAVALPSEHNPFISRVLCVSAYRLTNTASTVNSSLGTSCSHVLLSKKQTSSHNVPKQLTTKKSHVMEHTGSSPSLKIASESYLEQMNSGSGCLILLHYEPFQNYTSTPVYVVESSSVSNKNLKWFLFPPSVLFVCLLHTFCHTTFARGNHQVYMYTLREPISSTLLFLDHHQILAARKTWSSALS
jgi:hypothetical protein